MNNNLLGSPVVYQRQIRQAMAAPSSVRATPDLETAASSYMAGRAASQQASDEQMRKENLQQQALAEKARQFDATQAEKARQFDATAQNDDKEWEQKLADQRKYMDTWGKENMWANAIGVLNLGAQAVSSWDQNKKLDAQQAHNQQLMQNSEKQLKMTQDANEQQKLWQDAQLLAMSNKQSSALPVVNLNQIANDKIPYFLRREQ